MVRPAAGGPRVYNESVAQPLAQILEDDALRGPRGPDGCHEITVPAAWLLDETRVELVLPRLLGCADCEGGGCDRCERSGAVATRERGEPDELLEVQLPSSAPVVLRLPRHGGLPTDAALGRGVLLLTVRPGEASSGVRRLGAAPPRALSTTAPSAPSAWVLAVVLVVMALLGAWLARP